MSLDPTLPAQLQAAVSAVDAVRSTVAVTAQATASLSVPGWQGTAAARHQQELGRLRDLVARAAGAVAALEGDLATGSMLASQALAAEAVARAAEASAQAAAQGGAQGQPTYGPPWPGGGMTGYAPY